jgi:hypothetical protein
MPSIIHGHPLTARQKATIAQAATTAFHIADRAGLVDSTGPISERFTAWRHQQQLECTGQASLRNCGNNHYRSLMAHFLIAAGKDASAYRALTTTGKVKDHGAAGDTHEARETTRNLIAAELIPRLLPHHRRPRRLQGRLHPRRLRPRHRQGPAPMPGSQHPHRLRTHPPTLHRPQPHRRPRGPWLRQKTQHVPARTQATNQRDRG